MIQSNVDNTGSGRIVLRPNRSWTWRANLVLLATLISVSMIVAGAFALQGFWVVLPFSALEMSVLFLCLRHCVRKTRIQEVITLTRDDVIVERGRTTPEERSQFQRYWTRFIVTHGDRGRLPTVIVSGQGRTEELGAFLNVDDKRQLIRALRDAVSPYPVHPAAS